jgi:hypothetical protein
MAVRDPRVGHKTHGEERVIPTEYGGVTITDRFDGSNDATVRIKALRLNLTAGAPPNRELVRAIALLEEAQAEWLVAKHSDNAEWQQYVRRKLAAANLRVQEVQHGE